jgi:hypothetical protein
MKTTRLLIGAAAALAITACSVATDRLPAPPDGAANVTPASRAVSAAIALPLDVVTTYCMGTESDRVAVLSLPDGQALWDVFPNAGEYPELQALQVETIAVVYADGWPGELSQGIGSEPREPKPGTWDVCLEVADPNADIFGQSFLVLGGLPQADAKLPTLN